MTLLLLLGGAGSNVVVDVAGFIHASVEEVYIIHTDIEPIDTLTEEAEIYQVHSED